jgi:protein-tyrosine phosphatase
MSITKYTKRLANDMNINENHTENVSKILPRIYLGNYKIAKNKDFFAHKNIKAVLNCTKDLPNSMNCNVVEYMRIPIDDSLRKVDFDKFYEFLPVITQFIHKHVDIQKNNILIHCHAGKARSAGALIGYLMEFRGINPYNSAKLILEKRHEAFFHGESVNFEKPLLKYYKQNLY